MYPSPFSTISKSVNFPVNPDPSWPVTTLISVTLPPTIVAVPVAAVVPPVT